MGLNLNDIQDINVEGLEDQSHYDGPSGGFTFKKLPIGNHPVRLIEYIEFGMQPQKAYEGKDKPDADLVALTFEFLGKRTVEQKEDGTGEYAPRKTIYLKKSFHEKATYRKLFEKMRAGDSTITHMVQMVGKGEWLLGVQWTTKNDKGDKIVLKPSQVAEYEARAEKDPKNKDFKIYDNIRNDEGYLIGAAVRPVLDEDGEDTGEFAKVPVRNHIGELRVFLWDDPKPMFWDSIYKEGVYEKEVEGTKVEVSKNTLQERCLAATNFAGSALEAMLGGVDNLPGAVGADDGSVPSGDDDSVLDEGPSDEGKSKSADAPDAKAPTTNTDAKSPSEEEAGEFDELGL